MGRFDGVLLISDFDNTLVYTQDALKEGAEVPPLHPKNQAALQWFVAEGGRFAIATGRALAAFLYYAADLPINAPCVVANGGGVYDFDTEQYLHCVTLPAQAASHGQAMLDAFPGVAAEAYPISKTVYVAQPNHITRYHEVLTHVKNVEVATLTQVAEPLGKILFTGDNGDLLAIEKMIQQQPWAQDYTLIFSGLNLMEMTGTQASKGLMVTYLANHLDMDMAHVYCVGDEANDLSMLAVAAQAFAPENAIDDVKAMGATLVCHARDGAIAEVIEHLATKYE